MMPGYHDVITFFNEEDGGGLLMEVEGYYFRILLLAGTCLSNAATNTA
jgi:hypothetical protein